MLFLLRNRRGKALLIVQAANKVEADAYGRAHVPDFYGESVELDAEGHSSADQFQGVQTVRVSGGPDQSGATAVKARSLRPEMTVTHVWVRGLDLPDEVVEDDLLTPEDHRDLALDHIARTSSYIGRIEIRKWSRR